MTISDIKTKTQEKSPYFFTRDTLRFFGQRVGSFKVWKGKSGAHYIAAESFWRDRAGRPQFMGVTFRKFTGDDLQSVTLPETVNKKDIDSVREWVKTHG